MTMFYDALETRSREAREAALMAALPQQILHAQQASPAFAGILADVDAAGVSSRAALARLPVTRKSELLALQPGQSLLALCKATAVRIEPAAAATADAAGDNRLPGRVLRVARGSAHDELMLTLDDGQQLVGFAARPNRLRAGSRAQAAIDDSAVVLALG